MPPEKFIASVMLKKQISLKAKVVEDHYYWSYKNIASADVSHNLAQYNQNGIKLITLVISLLNSFAITKYLEYGYNMLLSIHL